MQASSANCPYRYDAAVDSQLSALALGARMERDDTIPKPYIAGQWSSLRKLDGKYYGYASQIGLRKATPFFVANNICSVIETAGMKLDRFRLTIDQFPSPCGYAYFERLLVLPELNEWLKNSDNPEILEIVREYADFGVRSIMWLPVAHGEDALDRDGNIVYSDGLGIFVYCAMARDNDALSLTHCLDVPFAKEVHLDKIRQDAYDTHQMSISGYRAFAYLAALALFMQQKLTMARPEVTPRAARKRAQRANISTANETRVVLLRKQAYERDDSSKERKEIDWSCQWWVGAANGGFWRDQYYPSSGEHRPIWITPFLKGPTDKPVKEPSKLVFGVTR